MAARTRAQAWGVGNCEIKRRNWGIKASLNHSPLRASASFSAPIALVFVSLWEGRSSRRHSREGFSCSRTFGWGLFFGCRNLWLGGGDALCVKMGEIGGQLIRSERFLFMMMVGSCCLFVVVVGWWSGRKVGVCENEVILMGELGDVGWLGF
jgi:hypothetical protein